MMHFFAHAGHNHTVDPTVIPWWQTPFTVSVVLVIGFAALLAVAHYVFKASFGAKMVLAMAYLLVVGVLCYTIAPILSVAALTAGMVMALTTTMLQLAHKK